MAVPAIRRGFGGWCWPSGAHEVDRVGSVILLPVRLGRAEPVTRRLAGHGVSATRAVPAAAPGLVLRLVTVSQPIAVRPPPSACGPVIIREPGPIGMPVAIARHHHLG